MALIGQKVADTRVLALIESFLEQGVLDGNREWTPEQGTPQGAVVSPLLSNIYLDPLDHLMAETGLRDGALRRRLRGDVPDAGGSNRGTGSGERMDGISRTDAAPDQDAAGR
jgi:hypothetical protein